MNSINVSISFGCDTKSYEHEDIHVVLKSAEDNMYRNKAIEKKKLRDNMKNTKISAIDEKNTIEYSQMTF